MGNTHLRYMFLIFFFFFTKGKLNICLSTTPSVVNHKHPSIFVGVRLWRCHASDILCAKASERAAWGVCMTVHSSHVSEDVTECQWHDIPRPPSLPAHAHRCSSRESTTATMTSVRHDMQNRGRRSPQKGRGPHPAGPDDALGPGGEPGASGKARWPRCIRAPSDAVHCPWKKRVRGPSKDNLLSPVPSRLEA